MIINFIKMHGLGNDFVIIDNTNEKLILNKKTVKILCDRRLGIGCDQLIFTEDIQPSKTIKMSVYNSNGCTASACGNATRCVAYYAMKKYRINSIKIRTENRTLLAQINGKNIIVNMGKASYEAQDIPLIDNNLNTRNLSFPELGLKESGIAVHVGNPHIVFIVESFDLVNIELLGPKIENHSFFPEKINVEFVKIIDSNTLAMKVWERGTGITTACATGAMASFAVAHSLNLVNKSNVKIILDGGELLIHSNKDNTITIEGPAVHVFDGKIHLNLTN